MVGVLTRLRNNQVYNSDIDAATKLVPGSITGGLWAPALTYTGNLTVANLYVNGTATTLDTTNIIASDPLIGINRNQSGSPSYDMGLVMGRGNQTNVAMIWSEGNQEFQLQYTTETTAASTTGTINNSGYANLQAYGVKLNNATIATATITNSIVANTKTSGGYIDNTVIGATTANAAYFTTLNTTGVATLGSNVFVTGNIIPTANITYDLGNATVRWRSLYLSGSTLYFGNISIKDAGNRLSVYDAVGVNYAGITASDINNTVIGNTGAASGAFTTLSASSTTTLNTATAVSVSAGTIGNAGASLNGATLTLSGSATLNTATAVSLSAQNLGNNGATVTGNQLYGNTVTATNGGQLVGYHTGAIGANAANTGAFTTVTATSINANLTSVGGGQITGYFTGAIGANTPNSGAFTSLTVQQTLSANAFTALNGGQVTGYLTGALGANTPNSVVATSVTTTGGGQLIGYFTGAIGANTANTGAFTTLSTSGIATVNGNLVAASGTASTTTTTGALVVSGGAGVSGALNVGQGLNLQGNGQITTNQSTGQLFNSGVTTINIGGAATTVTIGAATGTTTVNNGMVVSNVGNSYGSGQGALQIAGGFYAGGDSYIAGNLIVANISSLGFTALSVNSPLVYLDASNISSYNYEIGMYSHKYDSLVGYNHTGLVRNHVDNAWYLFSNIRTEPTNVVDLANASIVYDSLKLGNLIALYNADATGNNNGTGVLQISGGASIARTLYAGSIQGTPIGNLTPSTGNFTTITGNLTSSAGGQINGYLNGALGANTPNSVVATSVTTTGGGQLIGYFTGAICANTANTGAFTTISASGTSTLNAITASSLSASTIGNSGASLNGATLTLSGSATLNGVTASSVSASTIGNSGATVQGGTVQTLGGGQVIGYFTGAIGANTPNSGVFTTLTSSGAATFNGNIVANSGTASTSTTTGALVVVGGAGVSGNINVGGNINVTGNLNAITANVYTQGGIFYGNAAGFGALYAGVQNFTSLPFTVAQFAGNVNSYTQINFENTNNGSAATTDFVVTANNGTDLVNYGDFGIAGSGYDNTNPNNSLGTSLYPNDTYLYAQGNLSSTVGGNLVIGASVASKTVKIIAGGVNAANVVATLSSSSVSISPTTTSTSTTTGALTVGGGAGIAGNIYSGGNVVATTSIIAPSMYNNSVYPLSGADLNKYLGVNGNLNVNPSGVAANLVVQGNSAAGFSNLLVTNGVTGQVGIKVAPNAITGNVGLQVNSPDSIIIAAGTTAQRPSNGTAGMIRYNTNSNQLEFYDAGAMAWTGTGSTFTTVTSDSFTGNGSQTIFTLSQSATTAGVIVAINGIIQIPITSYYVTGGTSLVFTEAPLSTDVIDARTIVTTAVVTSIAQNTSSISISDSGAGTGNASVIVNNNLRFVANANGNFFSSISPIVANTSLTQNTPTAIDSFATATFRGAKYVVSVSDFAGTKYQIAEVILTHNGTTPTLSTYGIVSTSGTSFVTFTTSISTGTLTLFANSSSAASYCNVQQIYMPV